MSSWPASRGPPSSRIRSAVTAARVPPALSPPTATCAGSEPNSAACSAAQRRCLSCVDGPLDARALWCDGAAVGCGHVSGLTWGSLRQAGLAASGFARVPRWPDSPRRSSHQGGSPHQPHIRQDRRSQPRSRIRDRGAPRERRHSLRRRVRALPDNGDAPLDWSGQARWSAALADVVSQAAGLSAAPSGMTPCVASRHSAIRSFRASATTMTLRWRRAPPPRRSRNHPTIALPGW
jgi:hypothetical protein